MSTIRVLFLLLITFCMFHASRVFAEGPVRHAVNDTKAVAVHTSSDGYHGVKFIALVPYRFVKWAIRK